MNSSVDGIAKRTQYKLHVTLLQNKTQQKCLSVQVGKG